jgi:D-alanyl-D-alanine carboxypeptidase
MTGTTHTQLFLLALIVGFLAGPNVMQAIQGTNTPTKDETRDPSMTTQSASVAQAGETQAPATTTVLIAPTGPYDGLQLEAKSVFVWDIATHRTLYSYNEHAPLPLASLTKMMMALVANDVLPKSETVIISPEDLTQEGDSGLFSGERWSFSDLLDFTLITSSNDAASAIASVAGAKIALVRTASTSDAFENKRQFIRRMNEKAQAIGLVDTYFLNESGLDIDSVTGGAYGTARDVAMLFEYIFRHHPELFTATAYPQAEFRSTDNIVHHVANTNSGVAAVSGLIGSKTGYTDLAGGNLAVIVDIGLKRPVVIVVLGSSRTGRFHDVDTLITATLDAITREKEGSFTR